MINSEAVAEFAGKFDLTAAKQRFNMLEALNARVLVTELRLWRAALSCRQLKTMAQQPLSLLYEKKRNLNIQINKKAKQEAQKAADVLEKGGGEPGAEKKPKKGGLKFKSKFDTKKKEEPKQV